MKKIDVLKKIKSDLACLIAKSKNNEDISEDIGKLYDLIYFSELDCRDHLINLLEPNSLNSLLNEIENIISITDVNEDNHKKSFSRT